MSKITNLIVESNKQKVAIELDGRISFQVLVEIAIIFHLKIGQILEKIDIGKIVTASLSKELYYQSLKLIAIRPRSVSETIAYCSRRFNQILKHSVYIHLGDLINQTRIIDKVIKELKLKKYLNDKEFTHWWIEQRQRSHPKGKLTLAYELKQKGINPDIIQAELSSHPLLTVEQVDSSIEKLLNKFWCQLEHQHLAKPLLKQRLLQRLLSRGYSYEQAKRQIDDFILRQYNTS